MEVVFVDEKGSGAGEGDWYSDANGEEGYEDIWRGCGRYGVRAIQGALIIRPLNWEEGCLLESNDETVLQTLLGE